MTVPGELERLGVLLDALAVNGEQFACVADNLTPGQMRGAFISFAGAVRAIRGHLGAVKQLAETQGNED
jgi:hypothetical protein